MTRKCSGYDILRIIIIWCMAIISIVSIDVTEWIIAIFFPNLQILPQIILICIPIYIFLAVVLSMKIYNGDA